jgi:uncharacterized protein DUF3604
MKHSRRDFIKTGSTALGSLAVPMKSHGESPPQATPGAVPPMDPPEGSVSVQPDEATAGKYGTWSVTYRVGKGGIKKYGGICLQFPDSWHSGIRNSANRLQSSDPESDNYISSSCSQPGIELQTWVEHEPGREVVLVKDYRPGLDGRQTRYIFVVRVWVLNAELQEGSAISVIYGDTSRGSRGMLAGIVSTQPEHVLMAIDNEGTGGFRLHPDRPVLIIRSGPAVELLAAGPSTLVRGKPAELLLSVVDIHQNPADSFDGEVLLRTTQGEADVPTTVQFTSKRGWEKVRIVPRATGIIRIQATGSGGSLYANTNPMKVFENEPELKTFWGDLHSHTHYSFDGVGHNNFEYARYTSGLDFYAMTDHSSPEGIGPNTPEVWAEYSALVDKHHDPGKFVTLHAYECSLGAPYGHHNVFFRGRPTGLPLPEEAGLFNLWQSIRAGEALTIPHHTGKMPDPIFWYPHNAELDRNIEIYSAHGLSEAYNPWHPLSFERSMFTDPSKSVRGPQYAQDAWIQGLELSTIASSDDHRAHPGQPQYGLAAVAATGLTRDAIFQALYDRRTYGTTGAKILLDFSVNDHPMGQRLATAGSPRFRIEAHGTDSIELVEILRYSKSDRKFRVIVTLHPQVSDFLWSGEDATFREDSIYYMRLRQAGLVRNRIVMAWSSPIWVTKA